MKILFTSVLMIIPYAVQAQYGKNDITGLLDEVIARINKDKNSTPSKLLKNFSVSGCEKPQFNPKDLIMMKESARSYKLKFGPKCDLEGDIRPLPFVSFPIQLKVRNLDKFHTIKLQNKITASFETEPLLSLNSTNGELISDKGTINFDLNYQVRIDPTKLKDNIKENLGGTISVSEAFNKKINVTRKFMVK